MQELLNNIKQCTTCKDHLPLGPNPVVSAHKNSKIVIIGQAPGTKVHASGIPWDDASGKQLRTWLNVTDQQFYNPEHFAIIPMGFCYPGKGKSGDLPPRKECAIAWREKLLAQLNNIQLTIVLGKYAQAYHLPQTKKQPLTELVKSWRDYWPSHLPLPHPSPRNNIWLKKNPWFEQQVLPELGTKVRSILKG